MNLVLIPLFLLTLIGCTNNKPKTVFVGNKITPCVVPADMEGDVTFYDLFEKYLITKNYLELCAEKVVRNNELLEKQLH